ncbi:type II toxin-antitoxin system RelE family toxin [Roseiflexus sp.]|jgi:Cytotoxic translational repressor of toxin-antitoxin stability system
MPYSIEYTEHASEDIAYFKKYERVIIVEGIEQQLMHEPLREARNRKPMKENTLQAEWELRIGSYRVFYNVETSSTTVVILAVGWKEHNVLYIQGKEYTL